MQQYISEFDRLKDPINDRVVKDLPLPPQRPMGITQLFPKYLNYGQEALPNPDILKEVFQLDGSVEKQAVIKIIKDCQSIVRKEPNLVRKEGDIAMIGDIHGQLYDLIGIVDQLLSRIKDDTDKEYGVLFLGDYVDRGVNGVEVLLYLMSLKICYPQKVTMLRGNHESRSMTEYFTFR